MRPPTLLERLRHWIGNICFSIYLWSMPMTQDEFWKEQEQQAEREKFSEEGIRSAVIPTEFYDQYLNNITIHNIVNFIGAMMTNQGLSSLDFYYATLLAARLAQQEKDKHGS